MKSLSELADSIKRGVEELAEENERLRAQIEQLTPDSGESARVDRLENEKTVLLSVVSALESYMVVKGETCWITVCERMEEYRKWRR